jgi:hypothetical protein
MLEVATRHVAAYMQELGYKQPNMRFVQATIMVASLHDGGPRSSGHP